ncbi:MAG: ABC transporter permease [Coriobacteriales bacterium]|jgi:putative ABC transport system permease protein|nr:ABC transporter permease [Coriobacteriales bacterium]
MKLRDLLYETWFSLSANKARSVLTILGIVIGIASVIAMTSLIGGMQNALMGELGMQQARMVQMSSGVPLVQADLDALEKAFPEYEVISPLSYAGAKMLTAKASVDAGINGVMPNSAAVNNTELESGRFITDEDQRRQARVVVIGRGKVRDLFGSEDAQALGQTVRIGPNAEPYTIVGIMAGDGMSQNFSSVLMPLSTLQMRLTGTYSFDSVVALAKEEVDVVALAKATQEFLTQRLDNGSGDPYVYVFSMKEVIDQLNVMMASFSFMLTAIASISLFVGGIGIMNMMLTNVTERTREIGLRKSLGAHTFDITKQFLAESIALCIVGGLFGIFFGYLGALGLASIINMAQPDIAFLPAIGVESVLIAVGVCAFIGIIFGFYPARRAAKLDPVESLRYQ